MLVSDEERLIRNVNASMSEAPVEFRSVQTADEAASWLMQEEADVILLSGCVHNRALKETVSLLRQSAKNAALLFCLDYVTDEQKQDMIAQSGVRL